ncbi:hypothetical protein, partial [Hymenobacter agri]
MAHPTVLADAPDESSAEAFDGIAAQAPAEADKLGSLQDFLLAGLPGPQEFVVRPGRDTLLIGQQGTQLFVPADAWDVPLTSGPVRLQLREFYTTPDIILAGLGTMSSGRLLETGGMIHVSATNDAGRPVALQAGRRLGLRMPAKELKPGMRLFRGEAVGRRSPNWVLDSLAQTTAAAGGAHSVAARRHKPERVRH